jgi:F420-non-reducing hydrogenase large subunit
MRKVSIDPITRLEGHGKIEIFVNDSGEVANVYFQVPELRGFERFCVGRPVEELARITPRICGVCPEAHHLASTKAIDGVFGVEPTPAGRRLRELLYNAFFAGDHTTHFFVLAGPDFVVGPTADPAERNILGVIAKVGMEIGGAVIKMRAEANELVSIIGGKAIHPVCGLPGGVSKALAAEERDRAVEIATGQVEFAKVALQIFNDVVLGNADYVDLIKSDTFSHETYYMGTVDEDNKVNFYDGKIRVVDPSGAEFVKFAAKDYLQHLAEHVEPYSYLVYPYLKGIGWQGFVDGKDSGVYRASPLSRLNAADGMATPLAQAEYERMYDTLGGKPVHATLATHWARLVELMYAAERTLELAQDPEIIDPNVRNIPTGIFGEGIGCVEAPRGTLYHHYKTDEKGMVTSVNLIVGTTNNNAAISMSLKKAAMGLIKKGAEIDEGQLNMVEMAFRAYDPCFGCATHSLPGEMPLHVVVRSESTGDVLNSVKRYV